MTATSPHGYYAISPNGIRWVRRKRKAKAYGDTSLLRNEKQKAAAGLFGRGGVEDFAENRFCAALVLGKDKESDRACFFWRGF